MNLHAVILCGGSGTRLWPLSRETYPKQFHSFIGNHTLFESTVLRAAQVPGLSSIIIVCNEAHRFMATAQAQSVLLECKQAIRLSTVLEPCARNTAPAIAAVAHALPKDDVMLVLPSDHHLTDFVGFNACVSTALLAVQSGSLCTFGIHPTGPETGYGYIEQGAALSTPQGAFTVARFVEKPIASVAEQLIATGTHTWNSGMFVMQAGLFLSELKTHAQGIYAATEQAVALSKRDDDFMRLNQAAFETSPNLSVDYAVFEHTDHAAIVPYAGDWSDLGSWAAVADLAEQQAKLNAPLIEQHVQINARNNHIHADKPVALVGVEDLVVVDTPDALLVTHKASSQQVKDAISLLKDRMPDLALKHRKVHRPWGWYDSLDAGEGGAGHQVKRIQVAPGASLSVQSHTQRSEHWIVVRGTASIGVSADTAGLSAATKDYVAGDYVFIPLGAIHRLSNHTATPVEIIEVQIGKYLGEDDIKRYEDVYGRA